MAYRCSALKQNQSTIRQLTIYTDVNKMQNTGANIDNDRHPYCYTGTDEQTK